MPPQTIHKAVEIGPLEFVCDECSYHVKMDGNRVRYLDRGDPNARHSLRPTTEAEPDRLGPFRKWFANRG